MAKRKRTSGARKKARGPEAPDAVAVPVPQATDRERAAARERGRDTATGPGLTGGDADADWGRAAQVGEEAVGGTVATPDQDVVDDLGDALGVPQAPDAEFRPSAEILEARDRRRWEHEP